MEGNNPSRVLHIRGVPKDVTETEVFYHELLLFSENLELLPLTTHFKLLNHWEKYRGNRIIVFFVSFNKTIKADFFHKKHNISRLKTIKENKQNILVICFVLFLFQ